MSDLIRKFAGRVKRSVNLRMLSVSIAFLAGSIISGCGQSGVNIDNAPYVPKIVVEGYLYCGETVGNIRLMRNFPIGSPVDTSTLYLTPSVNDVQATINGTPLSFDPVTQTYFSRQISVGYGQTYTLDVNAVVDGARLHTTSATTTPLEGFRIINRNMGSFSYNSSLMSLTFLPSPGTGFYAFSIVPDTATTANFIYNNVFRNKLDSADVAKNLNDYEFNGAIEDGINSNAGTAFALPIRSDETWFYGKYTVVGYAGDSNFKDYVLTAPSVQEPDGNFHEPILIFKGDGIGVFASAIADTATFTITR